jgi:hypothetical protein
MTIEQFRLLVNTLNLDQVNELIDLTAQGVCSLPEPARTEMLDRLVVLADRKRRLEATEAHIAATQAIR